MLFDAMADPHERENLADDPNFASVRADFEAIVGPYRPGKAK